MTAFTQTLEEVVNEGMDKFKRLGIETLSVELRLRLLKGSKFDDATQQKVYDFIRATELELTGEAS